VKIVVNGEPREIADAVNVGELVAKLALPAPATLVEHNGLALRRSEWVTRTIADGDRVELIRIVAGG
jgi:sulfur carrier protein